MHQKEEKIKKISFPMHLPTPFLSAPLPSPPQPLYIIPPAGHPDHKLYLHACPIIV